MNPVEIEKTRSKLVVTNVCPACSRQFGADITTCPDDSSLLCPQADALIETTIGNYRLLELIGKGGSSQVYRASNHALGRDAAFKVLDCRLTGDPEAVKRFQAGAQAIANLKHPGITSIYDYGLLADGRPYIVMEFVDGETLAQKLERGVIEPPLARQMFASVCDALQTAHEAGILHRDIKPSNLMISRDGTIKVVDFGLAKIISPDDRASITRTGAVVGTPAYMSPEQCFGRVLDAAADIYSLGCVLYESLTGKPVFSATSPFEAMQKHSQEQPRDLTEFDKTIPAQLSRTVLQCLSKDPALRFSSMQELKLALQGVDTQKVQGQERGKKAMMAAAACLGLAVAASAAFYFFGAGESTPPSPEPAIPVPSEVIRPLGVTGGDALSHLKRQFNEIDDNIRIMRSEGKSREADAAKQRLDEFKAMLQGPYPAPATKGPEIQMVGVYEGFGTLPGFQSQSINGKVNVLVTYKSNPVVLVLTAYEPVTWNLSLAPGVRIEKIVMISYYKCKIEGAPPGVPVVSSSYEGGEHGFHFEHGGSTPYSWGSGEHKSFSESLKKSLGELVVMEGDYNPGKDKRFELGPESLDWRAQHILWRMQSFYDEMTAGRKRDLKTVLSKLRFYGSWGDDYSLTLGELSPFETPKAMVTAREPVEGSATFDKDRNTWYVCATHNLYKVAADGTVTNLVPPDTLPRLSWLSGTAYDERRKKIYVVSYHVDNCVYSFDPGTGKWDVKPITDMRGWGLAYSKSDDSLYTLEELEDNRYSLVRMTVNGEVLSRFPLSEPLSDMRQRCPVVLQLADAGDYIFAVLSPHNSPEEEGAITYVIEKSSGKIVLTTQAKPRPKR